MSFIADDIRAFVEFLGHKPFILVGYDLGGDVAWFYAAKYPETLEKLVIISAVHPDVPRRVRRENHEVLKSHLQMSMLKEPGFVQCNVASNYTSLLEQGLEQAQRLKPGTFTEEDRQAYIEALSQPGMLECMSKYLLVSELELESADEQVPDKDMLAPISVSTLVIKGEKDIDNFYPPTQENLADLVPNVKVVSIPDGSHIMIYDHAELVNTLIQNFLET